MKFQYSVIFDNTEDARKWLEMLGYQLENQHEDGEYLVTHLRLHNSTPLYWCAVPLKQDKHIDSINCIGNSPLFKAVSAMREDTDICQWFYSPYFDEWAFCQVDKFSAPFDYEYNKATITELQERFKID